MAKVKKVEKKAVKSESKRAELERELKAIKEKEEKEDLIAMQKKYDGLVNDIVSSNLLTNEQLKKGGETVRQRYTQEVSGFTPVIDEINTIGKKLGKPEIGLGGLRK